MRPCVRSCPKNPAWSHLVQCFHHGKFLNCRKLSTKTLLQSTRIEVRFGLMGFWLPPFESFEFHRIRSIPQTLSIPTSQAMEWWDPSPCSWRANSAAAKIKGSLANFVSAGSYQRIQGLAVGTAGVDIRTSPNRFDVYMVQLLLRIWCHWHSWGVRSARVDLTPHVVLAIGSSLWEACCFLSLPCC